MADFEESPPPSPSTRSEPMAEVDSFGGSPIPRSLSEETFSPSLDVDGNDFANGDVEGDSWKSVDFSKQFATGEMDFMEKLTEFWTRNYLLRKLNMGKWKEKLKLDKVSAVRHRVPGGIRSANEKIKKALKIESFAKMTEAEPFVRSKDKASFMVGIFLLMITEYFLLDHPKRIHQLYMALFVPLMIYRFFTYHKAKSHYFMLDFCYYCQIVTISSLYVFPNNMKLFQVCFALTNGPLLLAVVAWKNSMVFHDIDKITSLFIHIFPPLVMFAERWYQNRLPEDFTSVGIWYGMMVPVVFYLLWQVFYILKTELLDSHKLTDPELITSSRWLSEIRPHPLYKLAIKKGFNVPPWIMLPLFQLAYTFLTLIPIFIVYHSFWAHVVYLLFVFATACWYAAQFYFDVFAANYSKRLQKKVESTAAGSEHKIKKNVDEEPVATGGKYGCSSLTSVVYFLVFFVLFLSCFLALIAWLC